MPDDELPLRRRGREGAVEPLPLRRGIRVRHGVPLELAPGRRDERTRIEDEELGVDAIRDLLTEGVVARGKPPATADLRVVDLCLRIAVVVVVTERDVPIDMQRVRAVDVLKRRAPLRIV